MNGGSGDVIEERASFEGYEVERILGRGGMGVVYEAIQSSLHRRVALKVLRPELAEDPTFVERLRREGRLQASIEHPHVLPVYEVGDASPHGLFLAMRFIDGPTLADLLRDGDLDGERALRLLGQIAGALDAAHEAGLVHRDVKPQNMLVGKNDFAFLADFGISRAGADSITASRPMLGTVAYVAPEVIYGAAPGPASDRYAFAATLFHCLTGDVVFPRGSDAAILSSHAAAEPPRISERRPVLPSSLDPIFAAALAKDPASRPVSAADLVAAVRAEIGERGLEVLGPPDPGTSGEQPSGMVTLDSEKPSKGDAPRRLRAGPLVAAVLIAAGVGAGAVALLGGGDETEGARPPEVPVPELAKGAQALGSDLGSPVRSVDCQGSEPQPDAPSCALAQVVLPGAQLEAPENGTIVGWSVRGANGELALDVIRPSEGGPIRVARSQWESAGNAAPYRFPTSVAVERGDLIGVELGQGAGIGVGETAGSTTERWLEHDAGAYGNPDPDIESDLDAELLLRADFVPGAKPEEPPQVSGPAAATAPDGRVRRTVRIPDSPVGTTVELVEVGNRVALDLLKDGRRSQRLFLPDLIPGSGLVGMVQFGGEVDVKWVNPSSGRVISHFFSVSRKGIDLLG